MQNITYNKTLLIFGNKNDQCKMKTGYVTFDYKESYTCNNNGPHSKGVICVVKSTQTVWKVFAYTVSQK